MGAEAFPNRNETFFAQSEGDTTMRWGSIFNDHVVVMHTWHDCSLSIGYNYTPEAEVGYKNSIFTSILFWGLSIHW